MKRIQELRIYLTLILVQETLRTLQRNQFIYQGSYTFFPKIKRLS